MIQKNVRQRPRKISVTELRSSDFDVVQFSQGHEIAQKALSFSSEATIALAHALPLGLRGDAHRKCRAQMAKTLGDGQRRLASQIDDLIETHFACLLRPGHYDLLAEACRPFVDATMGIITGLNLGEDDYAKLSDIFDPGASPTRRRVLEMTARQLTQSDATGSPPACPIDQLAIAVMGRDSLIGTLCASLHTHMAARIGQSMNAHPFEPVPIDTAVPYVWREKIVGKDAGTFFQFHYDQFLQGDRTERAKIFGVGKHSCLGKPHSLLVFERLAHFMSGCTLTVANSEISYRQQHVMKLPTSFEIEIY